MAARMAIVPASFFHCDARSFLGGLNESRGDGITARELWWMVGLMAMKDINPSAVNINQNTSSCLVGYCAL
jgi:hypothetical protein